MNLWDVTLTKCCVSFNIMQEIMGYLFLLQNDILGETKLGGWMQLCYIAQLIVRYHMTVTVH